MSYWTEQRVTDLKRLNSERLSASMIAAELGGISRNAVIGKLNRLGIGLSTGGSRVHRSPQDRLVRRLELQRKRRAAMTGQTRLRGIIERQIASLDTDFLIEFDKSRVDQLTPEQKAKTITFTQLGPTHCRWPYGDPRAADFCFCGHDKLADKPYCAPHAALAYNPPRAKADAA